MRAAFLDTAITARRRATGLNWMIPALPPASPVSKICVSSETTASGRARFTSNRLTDWPCIQSASKARMASTASCRLAPGPRRIIVLRVASNLNPSASVTKPDTRRLMTPTETWRSGTIDTP